METLSNPSRLYSQHGEDGILASMFYDSESPRYFVEVGVIDGLRFSNSLIFEKAGWKGLCVEPHPAYAPLAKRNRSCSVIQAAAGSVVADNSTFYAEPRGALSGLSPQDANVLRRKHGHYFQGFDKLSVRVATLDMLLEREDAPKSFEFISIDVEGTELDVLQGLSLSTWNPRVILVEATDPLSRTRLEKYLSQYGYSCARNLRSNYFFCRLECDKRRLEKACVSIPPEPTPHPLDAGQYPTKRQPESRILHHAAILNAAIKCIPKPVKRSALKLLPPSCRRRLQLDVGRCP